MPRKTKSPLDVPQTGEVWYFALRRPRTWVETKQGSGEFFRPTLFAVVNITLGAPIRLDILMDSPAPEMVADQLLRMMLKPDKALGVKPHRPSEINVEDKALVDTLGPLLSDAQVRVHFKPERKKMDSLMAAIEQEVLLEDEGDVDGILTARGAKPDLIRNFYAAAAAFYRAAPWVQLSNSDVLSVRVQGHKEPYLVIVMGQGGQEYGISLSRNQKELESLFSARDPVSMIPPKGRHVLIFMQPPFVPVDDADAAEKYGWELPEPDLYPVPVLYTPSAVFRPDAAMLRWYEAALRAIPVFVEQHLTTHTDGSHTATQAELTVGTSAGKIKVDIAYPGADVSGYEQPQLPFFTKEEPGELETEGPLPVTGFRGMERILNQAAQDLGAEPGTGDPALQKAQDLMYGAWESPKPDRRIALAHQALKISPDCADAYVLLAGEEATTPHQALQLYQAGVEAGRRALGEAFFQDPENVGYFWGILETRPYMRAMQGVAETLWALDRKGEAQAVFRELLRLNPGDNQGIRYELLDLLLETGQDDAANELIRQYQEDWSASFAYAKALLAFRRFGEGPQANGSLMQAISMNAYVPAYLTGKKRIPSRMPDYISPGREDEAISCAVSQLNAWRKTPGAVDWLKKHAPHQK